MWPFKEKSKEYAYLKEFERLMEWIRIVDVIVLPINSGVGIEFEEINKLCVPSNRFVKTMSNQPEKIISRGGNLLLLIFDSYFVLSPISDKDPYRVYVVLEPTKLNLKSLENQVLLDLNMIELKTKVSSDSTDEYKQFLISIFAWFYDKHYEELSRIAYNKVDGIRKFHSLGA